MSRSIFSTTFARMIVAVLVLSGLYLDSAATESFSAQTRDETGFVEISSNAVDPPEEFTLTFYSVDLAGKPLPFACYKLGTYGPSCDKDGDGAVTFTGVEPGRHLLTEMLALPGFETYPPIELEITRDEEFSVPHNPRTGEVRVPTPAVLAQATGVPTAQAVPTTPAVTPMPAAPQESNTNLTGCEIVELYPGYPGYRGVVAGLVGRSDTACLADLEALDPTFSKAAEDTANLQIEASLGVEGDPPLWTWEAWMAIGAERGFGFICFVCLAFPEEFGLPPTVPVGPAPVESGTDPRLELSIRELQPVFISRFVSKHGVDSILRDSDQSLRIHAYSL